MNQISIEAGELLIRLCFFGPILYLGLLMAINPEEIIRFPKYFASELEQFRDALRGTQWSQPSAEPDSIKDSSGNRALIKAIGLTLVIICVLLISDLIV